MRVKPEEVNLAGRFHKRLEGIVRKIESHLAPLPLRLLAAWFDDRLPAAAVTAQQALLAVNQAIPISAQALESGTVLWPADLPLPVSTQGALSALHRHLPAMARELAEDVEQAARVLVEAPLLPAVLSRPLLVERWDLPGGEPAPKVTSRLPTFSGWVALDLLTKAAAESTGELDDRLLGPEYANGHWPPQAAVGDAVEWAKKGATRMSPDYSRGLVDALAAERVLPDFERAAEDGLPRIRLPAYCLGLLYLAHREVDQARRRPIVAIDAGVANHKLLSHWRDLPKHPLAKADVDVRDGIVEIWAPDRAIQLSLRLDDQNTISESTATALRQMWSWEGLRNWVAFHRLLSVEGARAGWVRWNLDSHLESLGYAKSHRTRTALREKTARQVERFTEVHIAIRAPDGQLRERRPLVLVGSKFDRAVGSQWRLEGMELQINPLLYSGVRATNGQLGENWHPAPIELAQVDHVRHPHTLALGMILPIRWRLAMNQGRQYVVLSGAKLLELAGVELRGKHLGEAWTRLKRDLEELRRIDGVGRWEWEGEAWRLASTIKLWPAEWLLDRTHRDVPILELPPGPPVLTGAELRSWRQKHGWTQTELAKQLGVHQTAVSRGERRGEKTVDKELASKIRSLRTPAPRDLTGSDQA